MAIFDKKLLIKQENIDVDRLTLAIDHFKRKQDFMVTFWSKWLIKSQKTRFWANLTIINTLIYARTIFFPNMQSFANAPTVGTLDFHKIHIWTKIPWLIRFWSKWLKSQKTQFWANLTIIYANLCENQIFPEYAVFYKCSYRHFGLS